MFLTNNFKLAAKTIADVYKARWQVELFKWIKQNLKIKSFVGTSKNAVMTNMDSHVRVPANCISEASSAFKKYAAVIVTTARDLMALLRGDPPDGKCYQIHMVNGTAVGSYINLNGSSAELVGYLYLD